MKIPKGWRKMQIDETIQKGNRFYSTRKGNSGWIDVVTSIGKTPEDYSQLTFIKRIQGYVPKKDSIDILRDEIKQSIKKNDTI